MKFCFDADLMRPGCVLLAVIMGGDTTLAKQFPSDMWLLNPTPGLKVYETTEEQINFIKRKLKVSP